MILPLRLISGGFDTYFYSDPKLVNETNFPIILIVIVCLFIAYYKQKAKKYNFKEEEVHPDEKRKFRFQSYDVLMQPKRDHVNLSLVTKGIKYFSYRKTVVGFLLFFFYYLLFTGKL